MNRDNVKQMDLRYRITDQDNEKRLSALWRRLLITDGKPNRLNQMKNRSVINDGGLSSYYERDNFAVCMCIPKTQFKIQTSVESTSCLRSINWTVSLLFSLSQKNTADAFESFCEEG